MFNAWEAAIPSGAKIIHKSGHKFRILQMLHCIIDSQIHRIGFRIIKKSRFRIPLNPNRPEEKPPIQIRLELTLTQSIWRSIEAISEKRATIQSSLSYFDKGQELTRFVSIPNSGRAFQCAMTLYDKQIVLQESLYAGFAPKEAILPQINTTKRNRIYILLKFISVRIISKIEVILNQIQRKKTNWSIGFLPLPDFPPPNQNEIKIENYDTFAADPFLCTVNSKTFVFFETLKNGKGVIECAEVNSRGIGEIATALVENFHLSYPFILKHDGNIFMIPETSEKEEIRLYKSTAFPTKWIFDKTLISDVLAADSILVQNENGWHLLTNLSSGMVKEFGSELWHFSARDLFQEEWTPNLHNPISMDANVSRNAGCYKIGPNLFRCNQVPGFSQYGFGVEINQTLQLDNSGYRESSVEKHLGGYHANDSGCHHLSFSNGIIAYDFSYESKNCT
jgi:hypothetical protein